MEAEKKNNDMSINSVEDFPRVVLALSAINLAPFPVMKFGW